MHSPRTKVHIMRTVLYFLHLTGFVSIPDHYEESWKNRCHQFYSRCVLSLLQLYALSTVLAISLYSIKDFSEFAEKFVDSLMCGTCVYGLFYLSSHMELFLVLLNEIETFQFYHRRNTIVSNLKKIQEQMMRMSYWGVGVCVALMNLFSLVPKSESELVRLQKIYGFKHPQNTFMTPLYIPYVDTSEPRTYVLLFLLNLYIFFLLISAFAVSMICFPLFAFDMKACADIASEFAMLLGHDHRDAQDRRIFYTNIIKNEYILRDWKERDDTIHGQLDIKDNKETVKGIRYVFLRNPEMYDYFYFCQVIFIQKKLQQLRKHLDVFYDDLFTVISGLFLVLFMMSTYSCLLPSYNALNRTKSILEAANLVAAYFLYFVCGEMIADTNPSLARAVWFSHWYRCSMKTQKGILMILKSTLKIDYIVIFHIMELRFSLLVSTLRFSYSCFNFMNLRRQKNK